MPVTAGFVGIIPALEYLVKPEKDGLLRLPPGKIMLLSAGLCFFRLIFAALFHRQLIIHLHMLMGAIFGWGMLSTFAKDR